MHSYFSQVVDYDVFIATIDDIEDLTDFRILMFDDMNLTFNEAETRQTLREYFQRNITSNQFTGWLAKTENDVVASGGMIIDYHPPGPNNPSGKIGYIINMSTKHQYRRRGIARRIVKEIISWGIQNGITVFSLHATEIGKPLYESLGFKDSNEMRLKI